MHPIVQALPLGITMLCLTKSGSAYQVTEEYPGELAWDVRGNLTPLESPLRILLPLNSVDYLDEQSKSIRNAQ